MARIMFLCARGSSRSLMAASILHAQSESFWDIWSTLTQDGSGRDLAKQVLQEQGISLLSSDHLLQPTFGMRWDEGVILCSGAAAH